LLHEVGLFATATTIASSTIPPASRMAPAQSRNVAPVVQTSSNSVTRHPATAPGLQQNVRARRDAARENGRAARRPTVDRARR
jgi:hypothetical protein